MVATTDGWQDSGQFIVSPKSGSGGLCDFAPGAEFISLGESITRFSGAARLSPPTKGTSLPPFFERRGQTLADSSLISRSCPGSRCCDAGDFGLGGGVGGDVLWAFGAIEGDPDSLGGDLAI